MYNGIVGAGAAYYVSFLLPRRVLDGPVTQVWGLIGAAVGIAVGSRHWAGGSPDWRSQPARAAGRRARSVPPHRDAPSELSAQGYLPFGVGLSIAAVVLAFTGGLERVREIFAEIAPGLGL